VPGAVVECRRRQSCGPPVCRCENPALRGRLVTRDGRLFVLPRSSAAVEPGPARLPPRGSGFGALPSSAGAPRTARHRCFRAELGSQSRLGGRSRGRYADWDPSGAEPGRRRERRFREGGRLSDRPGSPASIDASLHRSANTDCHRAKTHRSGPKLMARHSRSSHRFVAGRASAEGRSALRRMALRAQTSRS
jgi:hypothetical protein